MTPLERAEFEAKVLCGVLEWLEPENIDRFLELAREQNRSLFESIIVVLRRSSDRPGMAREEVEERKALFRECDLDWDNCL